MPHSYKVFLNYNLVNHAWKAYTLQLVKLQNDINTDIAIQEVSHDEEVLRQQRGEGVRTAGGTL